MPFNPNVRTDKIPLIKGSGGLLHVLVLVPSRSSAASSDIIRPALVRIYGANAHPICNIHPTARCKCAPHCNIRPAHCANVWCATGDHAQYANPAPYGVVGLETEQPALCSQDDCQLTHSSQTMGTSNLALTDTLPARTSSTC